ncbi:MAG: ComF family protein [Streptosporangiaceae bacterium]
MTELPLLTAFPDCHDCACFRGGSAAACLACASGQMSRPGPGACPVCSQRLVADGRCPNELCRRPGRRIGRIRAIGYQTGPLRRAIHSYKYGGARSWSVPLGRLLLGWLEQNMIADPPGLIVVNPGFAGADRATGEALGHTEAVLHAAAAADAAHRWPFDTATPAAIVKTRPTLKSADAQAWSKRVTAAELRDALRVSDPGRTAGRFILVYDDICTTGGQLDAIAGCLLGEGGAARVEGLVLARAPWRGDLGLVRR